MILRYGVVVSLFTLALVSSSAQVTLGAATITYTSLATWQAAVSGSSQFSETFSGFAADTYFQATSLNVGPFSLEQIGFDPIGGDFRNFIDVPPVEFSDNSGATNAAMYTKFGVLTVNMVFGSTVYGWGANFYGAQSGELLNMVLYGVGGGTSGTVQVTLDTGFFGFVTSGPREQIARIEFRSRLNNPDPFVGQGFGLENVVGAYNSGAAVPEPSSLFLLGSGLIVVLFKCRRTAEKSEV